METTLYLPVKAFLEAAGYVVKGEVSGCDIVGLSDAEPPVVVVCELKLSFNLELILQAVDRAAMSDEVWIAARVSAKGRGREADKRYRDLCRRLGVGMLGVSDAGEVSVIVSSVSPMPRTNPKRRSRLVKEHQRRRGDPVVGGGSRAPIMTAYRQQALLCASALQDGLMRPRDMKSLVPNAGRILLDNVYGWFERKDKGIYALTPVGEDALLRWPQSTADRSVVEDVVQADEIDTHSAAGDK
ncbi:DUF2161 family putative PD-(D/E)XK-type phosphodiesterase [Rhizobium sp. S96]|uniref:DUF2161 domain-containing phosphodiesterase n=1 Tax=Rhizobium sp. S96 TaxID=3055140 RepID=UPI0025AB3B24|nr:DUF2161 family putative PD-(D/E)XK-type phosphodiesterase [Rhizobium sp. S96]MDM9621684.1 DUF2161 family putative PD-(D/E)XK-type phosphodiesterase [Rhizobium sp. S96]